MDPIAAVDALPDDSGLMPLTHAGALQRTAPELAGLLADPALRAIVRVRDARAEEARAAQDRLRKVTKESGRILVGSSVLLAGVTVMLAVAAGQAQWVAEAVPDAGAVGFDWFLHTTLGETLGLFTSVSTLTPYVVLGCSLLAGLLAAWARIRLQRSTKEEDLSVWHSQRAAAEEGRLAAFQWVVTAGREPEVQPRLEELKVAYIHRFLLRKQSDWFGENAVKKELAHRARSTREDLWAWAATAAVLLAGPLAFAGNLALAAFAAVGAVASTMLARIDTEAELEQDRANSHAYRDASLALQAVSGELTRVRKAAAKGETEVVDTFMEAIVSVLESEGARWKSLVARRKAALQRLQDRLDRVLDDVGTADSSGANSP